jgi:predicted acyltransferase
MKQRLLSLDFFRGLTVAAMILVNNPGSWSYIYPPLEHSKWNGCTPTDLVFPFFLFMVGVSVTFALSSRKADAGGHGKLMLHIFRRAAIIFAIGLAFRLIPSFDFYNLRILGVLQRIAIVFLIISLLYIKTGPTTRIWLCFSFLVIYWLLMMVVPVPGVGPANLEPGTNLAAWLDRTIMGERHLWKQARTWDPEGILSTLPAISTGLLGIMTGDWIRRKDREDAEKVSWLFTAGFLSVLAGLVWDGFFPINKSLWTSSFVLYTGGLAAMGLALSYWLIDVQKYQRFTPPFVAFGRNAITAYVLSGVIPMIFKGMSGGMFRGYSGIFSPLNASLAAAITLVLLLFIPVWIMYKRNIIVKI